MSAPTVTEADRQAAHAWWQELFRGRPGLDRQRGDAFAAWTQDCLGAGWLDRIAEPFAARREAEARMRELEAMTLTEEQVKNLRRLWCRIERADDMAHETHDFNECGACFDLRERLDDLRGALWDTGLVPKGLGMAGGVRDDNG